MIQKRLIMIIILLVLFGLSLFVNTDAAILVEKNRNPFLDEIMLFATDIGLFIILSIISTYLIIKKKYEALLLVAAGILLSLECSYILKKVFQIPRPEIVHLTHATGYTFPSIHAAIVVAIIPFTKRIFKNSVAIYFSILFLTVIAISRAYLGVHYLGDIIFGGLMGLSISTTIIHLQERYQIYQHFIYHLLNRRETRRQVAHLLSGLAIVLLFKLNILNIYFLGGLLILGGILSILSMRMKVPILYEVLKFFERPNDLKMFPGKGSFFLVFGAFLSFILFEEKIALAAIAIMAVGDSATTIIGIYFGKIKNPLNPKKHIEGTAIAIILATITAFNFVSFEKAILAASIAMIFETLTFKKLDRIIDDNVVIPIIAGYTITVMT